MDEQEQVRCLSAGCGPVGIRCVEQEEREVDRLRHPVEDFQMDCDWFFLVVYGFDELSLVQVDVQQTQEEHESRILHIRRSHHEAAVKLELMQIID